MSTLLPETITPPQPAAPHPTWLWPNRIPLGKITLLAGDPGLGKSFLALDIAARLSTGAPMPDQTPPSPPSPTARANMPPRAPQTPNPEGPPISDFGFRNSDFPPPCHPVTLSPCLPPSLTLLLSAEDELHDTILPRLASLHADQKLVFPIRCLNAQKPAAQPFSLKTHLDFLRRALEVSHAKLIILDPITAFMEGIDQNSTSSIRQYLTPLAQLAAFHGTAILAITHLSKEAHRQSLYRATGSLALAAVARSVHLVHQSPALPTPRANVPPHLSQPPKPEGPPPSDFGFRNSHFPPLPSAPSIGNWQSEIGNPASLFSPIKSNLSSPPPPLPFRIHNNTLEWLPCTARPTDGPDPLSPQSSALGPDFFDHHDRQTALDFLKESLAQGPQPAIPLIRQAKALAISERTLNRAKAQLGILSKKDGLNQWLWLLPQRPHPI